MADKKEIKVVISQMQLNRLKELAKFLKCDESTAFNSALALALAVAKHKKPRDLIMVGRVVEGKGTEIIWPNL